MKSGEVDSQSDGVGYNDLFSTYFYVIWRKMAAGSRCDCPVEFWGVKTEKNAEIS